MAEKAAVILNPSSGRGKGLRKKNKVVAALDAKKIDYDLFVTTSEEHLVETTVKVIQDYGVIIGAGGDTSINLIAHEILRFGRGNVLGIISLGSTNDLARELGVNKLGPACSAVVSGVTRKVDVGRILSGERDEPYTFLAQASLGLGVAVNRYVADWMEKHHIASRWHSPAQATAGLTAVYNSFKNKIIPMSLELHTSNGIRFIDSSLLTFNNTSVFAKRFKPSPWASPIDGKLDCCIFNSTSFTNFLRTALQVNSNRHLVDNKVDVFQDSYFKLISSQPFEFQVDGEVVQSGGQIEISVQNKALEVLINPDACSEVLRGDIPRVLVR